MKNIIVALFLTFSLALIGQEAVGQVADNPTDGPRYTVYSKNRFKQNPKHTWSWFNRKRYYSIGGSINSMNYFGDITPQPSFTSTDIRFSRANFSAYIQRRLYPGVTGRIMFSYGTITGIDTVSASPSKPRWEHNQFRYIRNVSFRSRIYELAGLFNFDLVKNRGVFYQRPQKVIPYLSAGFAFFYHNPKTIAPDEFGGGWVKLQPLRTEGQGRVLADGETVLRRKYSLVQIAIPLGFGFRYKISPRWDVAFEANYRWLVTDYLDDVSGNYIDLGVFGSSEEENLARALHDRSREGGRALDPTNMYVPPDYTYTGIDGRVYTTFLGFGNDQYPDNIRGNSRDKDVYLVTGFHLSYILPGQVRCPEPFKKRFRAHRL